MLARERNEKVLFHHRTRNLSSWIFLPGLGTSVILNLRPVAKETTPDLAPVEPFTDKYNVKRMIGEIQDVPFDPYKEFHSWFGVISVPIRLVFSRLWEAAGRGSAVARISPENIKNGQIILSPNCR
jgi:hypothetical protein